MTNKPTTRIATSTPADVFVRDKSLCGELLGRLTFTEMIYFQITGRTPNEAQTALLDACLVTLMEHGLTPSALAARLVYGSSPDAMQGGVAAGLLAVGSRFVGTVEDCGRLLERIVGAEDASAECAAIVADHRARRAALPGFGHPQHRPDDPRSLRLFELARQHGVSGAHIAALQRLSAEMDRAIGKHLTINATGAVAAVLADCAVPLEIARGIALIARCAGLVGHIYEEQQDPSMTTIWHAADHAIPYAGTAGDHPKPEDTP